MKKYISFIILAGLMCSFTPALAEDSNEGGNTERPALNETMKAKREAFKDKLKTERESFLAELKLKKEAWKSANMEKRAEWRTKAKDMLDRRFEVAVRNLERVQAWILDLINKSNIEDTTDATTALNSSKQKLSEAKVKITEIKVLLPTATSETVTPENFEKIKLLAREAKDLLKESREYLHEAIKIIKDSKE